MFPFLLPTALSAGGRVVTYIVVALLIAVPSGYGGYRLGSTLTENRLNKEITELTQNLEKEKSSFQAYRDEQEKIASALELSASKAAADYTRATARYKANLAKSNADYAELLRARGEVGCTLSSAAKDTINDYVRGFPNAGAASTPSK